LVFGFGETCSLSDRQFVASRQSAITLQFSTWPAHLFADNQHFVGDEHLVEKLPDTHN